jgi:hypothetical protein
MPVGFVVKNGSNTRSDRLPRPIRESGWKVFCARCHHPRQDRGNCQHGYDRDADCDRGRFAGAGAGIRGQRID